VSTLERAIQIAVEAHRGQKDKAGAPYILHPLRVMLSFDTETEMIVAVLHDVIEDSSWTASRLRAEGFSEEIVEAVECVTTVEGEPYEDFVDRAKSNPIARRVKIADLEDNMDVRRIADPGDKDGERLKKYHRTWKTLSRGQ
jgi:(p)ppGpp synthase/HD superfamily hydrolase